MWEFFDQGWDDRRRISQFTWESTDPTSEQQAIKGAGCQPAIYHHPPRIVVRRLEK